MAAINNSENFMNLRMMIDRSAAVPQPGVAADGLVDETLGARDGLAQRRAAGQPGSDGGRIGAAGSMGVARRDARGGEFAVLRAIEQQVGGIASRCAAFDQHRARAHGVNQAGCAARVVQVADGRFR